MLALLLACTHKPAPLFPTPFPRAELAPVVVPDADPEECLAWHPVLEGDPSPCTGVVGPSAGPRGALALVDTADRHDALEQALSVCYDGRASDRAWAEDRYGACHVDLHAAEVEARGLRVGVVVAFVGGVAVGGMAVSLGGWAVGQAGR